MRKAIAVAMATSLFAIPLLAISACSKAEADSSPIDDGYVAMVPAKATPLTQESADMPAADFASELASNQMFELEASRLALQKSPSPEVRAFAQSMIDTHSQANAKLKKIAASSSMTLPGDIYTAQQVKIDTLANGEPETFDRFYMIHQLETHSETLALLEGYSANGSDPALKQLATSLMPLVAGQLDAVRRMNSPAG